jgi:GNAT superfamily N-acetyltransferase
MQIIPVSDATTAKQFLQTAVSLYKNDLYWTQPLDKDINDVFNPAKNKAFRFGEAQRWIVKNDAGKLVGRIAAFVNSKYKNKGDEGAVGGIGFFECENSQHTANLLLDTAKEWLQQKGMYAIDGPINFGERDRWWGMVTDGFHSPLYCMNYNPPFYIDLFKNYGFQVFYNQICFGFDPRKPLSDKIIDRHRLLEAEGNFAFKTIKKNELEKFALDFSIVYNKAWAGHGGLKEMSKEQVLLLFKKMKPVIDERIVYFAYHKNEPIAIFLNIPDLNHYFKRMRGKFGLLQKLYFLWLKLFNPSQKFNGLIFGVVPEWQGKGVDAYLIRECGKILQTPPYPYIDYEMQWIGDFNPKMINVAENFADTFRTRNLATWRYIIDTTKTFKRHPIL